jgi:hypothetical protein
MYVIVKGSLQVVRLPERASLARAGAAPSWGATAGRSVTFGGTTGSSRARASDNSSHDDLNDGLSHDNKVVVATLVEGDVAWGVLTTISPLTLHRQAESARLYERSP